MAARGNLAPCARLIRGAGVDINVWDYGGPGAPLLLCHCTGACARVWDPVIERLDRPFHVYSIDTRGHGDSQKPASAEECAWPLCGEDILAVIDGLGLGAGVLAVGHSGGAAQLAYAEMIRPGTLGRALWIDPIIGPRSVFAGESSLAAGARRRREAFESRDAARARFAGRPPMNAWCDEALDAYVTHGLAVAEGAVTLKCRREHEAWMYKAGGACDVFEQLDALTVTVQLVTGEHSEVAPLVRAQHARLRGPGLHVVPGAGHFIPQEQPAAVAALIDNWLS